MNDPEKPGPGPVGRSVRIARLVPPEIIAAAVEHDLPADRLFGVESEWHPGRSAVARAYPDVEHTHWDWRNKFESVAAGVSRLIAVNHDGQTQGLMAVSADQRPGALAGPERPVLYVDYLEVAPWNLRLLTRGPRFTGVGKALIAEAVRRSVATGCGGRIGLHSLPQAEAFYTAGCAMTRVGPDTRYHDLVYFEFTDDQAARFLVGAEL